MNEQNPHSFSLRTIVESEQKKRIEYDTKLWIFSHILGIKYELCRKLNVININFNNISHDACVSASKWYTAHAKNARNNLLSQKCVKIPMAKNQNQR